MQCVCYVCATCVLCAVYSVQVMRGMWQPCAVWLALVCVWGLPCVLLATVWLWRLACPSPVVSVGRTEREGLPPGNVGCCALEAALRGSGDQGLRPPLLTLHSVFFLIFVLVLPGLAHMQGCADRTQCRCQTPLLHQISLDVV